MRHTSGLTLTCTLSAVSLLLTAAPLCALSDDPKPAPTPSPAAPPANGGADKAAEGTARLKAFLLEHGKELELSTGPGSVSDRFFAGLRFAPPDQKKPERSVTTSIYRNGNNVSVLFRSRLGEDMAAYCVVANGVAVGLDPSTPGGILVAQKAYPEITFAGKDGALQFFQWIRWGPDAKPFVLLDMRSIAEGVLQKAVESEYDEPHQIIRARTARTAMTLRLAAADANLPCPVAALTLGFEPAGVGLFVLGKDVDPALDFSQVTPDAIAALHVPTRPMTHDSVASTYFMAAPTEFHTDPKHREVAQKLYYLVAREQPRPKGDAK